MDVKVSSANEARTVSVSSTAHIPLLSNETKSSAERNSDSGYHSWSSIECQSSKNLTDRSNMQSVASGLDQAEKSCLNGSTPFSDPSYSSACLKDQTMDKVVFSHANAHCNHNVCNYSRESHKRLSDVDNNANVISKINESGNMTMNSHSEHCIVTTCCGCLSFTNSTSSIVQSTSRSSIPFHHPNYQPQTQTLFSHSSQEAMSNVLENSKDNLQSEAQDLAMKIEFCLKFGYTTSQIRSVISKISYKATKNDIIQELFNVSSVENGTLRSSGQMPLTDLQYSYNQDVNHAKTDPKYEKFVGRGISPSSQDIYQSRGPLSLDETKEPPKQVEDDSLNLRPIVIDGSNVAMSHGNKQYFSCKGILLAVDYFRSRNHRDITVFIPAYRKESPRPDAPIQEREILDKLEKERILVYTPSRCINGIRVTCYDDRFILRLAEETDGVVVSNDNFRDLQNEKPQWKELIEKRLLMYSFVNDRFMPPDDPLGRNGPSIDNFLRKRPACEEQIKPQCPYGKKCTYGKKCKFFHPECSFSQKSVTDQLKEKSEKRKKASMEAENLAEEFLKSQPHRDTVSNLGPRKNETPTMLPGSDGIKPKDGEMMNDLSSGSSTSSSGRLPTFHSASSQANHGQRLTGGNVQPYHGHHNSGYQWPVMGHPDPNRQQYAHNSDGGLSDAFKQMAMSNNSPHHVQNMHGNNNPYNTMHRVVDAQMMQQHHQQQQQQPYSNPPFVRQQHQQQAYRYPDSGGPPDLHAKTGRNLQPPNIVQQNSSPGAYQPVYEGSGGMRQMVHPQHYNMPNHHPQFASMPPHAPYVQPHPMFQYNNQHNQSPLHQPMIYSPYANMHPGMVQQQNMHHGMVQPALYMPLSHGSGSISRSMPGEPLSSSSANSDDPKTFPPRRINQKQQQVGFDQGCGAYVNSGSHGVHQHNQHTPNSAEVSLDSQVNPRHNLFKNLCGLFPRVIVEKVMMDNPEMREPKKLIKLCLEEEN